MIEKLCPAFAGESAVVEKNSVERCKKEMGEDPDILPGKVRMFHEKLIEEVHDVLFRGDERSHGPLGGEFAEKETVLDHAHVFIVVHDILDIGIGHLFDRCVLLADEPGEHLHEVSVSSQCRFHEQRFLIREVGIE